MHQLGAIVVAVGLVWPALAASPVNGTTASDLCRRADAQYRQGSFDEAAALYRAASTANPNSARAWFGLGRVAKLNFRDAEARNLFSRAYDLDPLDPEIRAAQNTAPRAHLSSPYTSYDLKLTGFYPRDATAAGVTVTVRINGGKPLRLVLDTGARGISIRESAARDARLVLGPESRIQGFERGSSPAHMAVAESIAFGDLTYRDCPVAVSSMDVASGADGVMGTALFQEFEVRLDAGARMLRLQPYRDAVEPGIRVYGLDGLLVVKARVNRDREGLFLIDTGSAYTAVDSKLAKRWGAVPAAVALQGVAGLVTRGFRVAPVELEIDGRKMHDPSGVAVDLGAVSDREGVEFAGLIGYSVLGKSPLILNYRDGMIDFR